MLVEIGLVGRIRLDDDPHKVAKTGEKVRDLLLRDRRLFRGAAEFSFCACSLLFDGVDPAADLDGVGPCVEGGAVLAEFAVTFADLLPQLCQTAGRRVRGGLGKRRDGRPDTGGLNSVASHSSTY